MIVHRTYTVAIRPAGNDNPGTMESEIAAYEDRQARIASEALFWQRFDQDFARLMNEIWRTEQ